MRFARTSTIKVGRTSTPDIRDENLRLIYVNQEEAHVSARLKMAKRNLFINGILLLLVAALWTLGANINLYDVRQSLADRGYDFLQIAFGIGVGVLFIIPFVSAACLIFAATDLIKYLGFRKNHEAFLRRYNRTR